MYPSSERSIVVDLATRRRREENVIESLTLVFGGVHYGTVAVRIPYASDKPIRLFLAPVEEGETENGLAGRVDALVTDDETAALELEAAR